MLMIGLEIRLLFLNYSTEKSAIEYELLDKPDKSTKKQLEDKIKSIEKLQLNLIQQYMEEVKGDLPLEMQRYFTGERLDSDNTDILIEFLQIYGGIK